jgi:hypothetical protein
MAMKRPAKKITSAERDLKTFSREELFELFKWLDFKDKIGHPLTMCQDFINLVDRAVANQEANQ